MKRLPIVGMFVLMFVTSLFSQTITLNFIGKDTVNQYVPMRQVLVRNLSKGWQDTLCGPELQMSLQDCTGVRNDSPNGGLSLSQNTPNPFSGVTYTTLSLSEESAVTLDLTDMLGHIVSSFSLDHPHPGYYRFQVVVSNEGQHLLVARQRGKSCAIKLLNVQSGGTNSISFLGTTDKPTMEKRMSGFRDSEFPFEAGDMMEFVGIANINGNEMESAVVNISLDNSQDITLLFYEQMGGGRAASCPSDPMVVDFDGNIYNTIQIGTQCWMKENLRTTHFPDGSEIPLGGINDTLPIRTCPGNSAGNVATYGYLYNWPATMNFPAGDTANVVAQGVCPNGWHVPSYDEWITLLSYLGSQSECVCGTDTANIAKSMASTCCWWEIAVTCAPGCDLSSNNASGFSVVGAGKHYYGLYQAFTGNAFFWSSTKHNNTNGHFAKAFAIGSATAVVQKVSPGWIEGCSVRCLRD